ncbi:MAG: hypothetical protein GQ531_04265 [Sulfurovum sp.]|nr:hypothetical protein [Sulfurovum sp.]
MGNSPSQVAKGKCGTKNNQAATKSDSADCCCMVAPWVIEEENRSYKLNVTKTKEQEVMINGKNETKTVPDKEEPSNKEKNTYELHVVTPALDKDGKETYKKITSNHTFLKKECDLKMLVKNDTQEKSIDEGGSFEIDTKGAIKGALMSCKNNNIFDFDSSNTSMLETHTPNMQYVDANENTSAGAMTDLNDPMYTMDFGSPDDSSEFKTLIISMINPNDIAKKFTISPTGSTKCVSQPKVVLYVHDKAVYKGELSLAYGFAHTLAENRTTNTGAYRNERIDITRSAFKVEGKLEYELGSTHYIIEGKHSKGFDEKGNRQVTQSKRKSQHLERIDAENIFSGFREKINGFHRFFDKVQKAQSSPIKINTGLTKFTLKVDGSCDEDNSSYKLKRIVNNFEIDLNLFDGAAVTLDILELGCMLGGPIGKVLSKARDYAEDKGQELKLEFSLGGSINGNLKFSRADDSKPWSAEGKVGGKINIEILGSVKLDGSVLWVKVTAGAYFKSGSKVTENNKTEIAATLSAKTNKDDILIDGNIEFNGMTMYFASYLEVGKQETKSSNGHNDGGRGSDSHNVIDVKREFKAQGQWPLLDEWTESKNFGKVNNFIT